MGTNREIQVWNPKPGVSKPVPEPSLQSGYVQIGSEKGDHPQGPRGPQFTAHLQQVLLRLATKFSELSYRLPNKWELQKDAPGKCYWGTFWAPVEEYIDPGWATGIKCMDPLPRRSHNMLCQLCVLWISRPTRCPQENVAGEMWVAGSRVHISDSGWTRCIKLMEPFLRIRPNMP